jgi:hypothetical protein
MEFSATYRLGQAPIGSGRQDIPSGACARVKSWRQALDGKIAIGDAADKNAIFDDQDSIDAVATHDMSDLVDRGGAFNHIVAMLLLSVFHGGFS